MCGLTNARERIGVGDVDVEEMDLSVLLMIWCVFFGVRL